MVQKTNSPDPATVGTGAGKADHAGGGYKPPVVAATGATAGAPGAFTPQGSTAPANAAGAVGKVTANPNSAWTTGQYVQGTTAGAAGQMYWDGSKWVAGKAA